MYEHLGTTLDAQIKPLPLLSASESRGQQATSVLFPSEEFMGCIYFDYRHENLRSCLSRRAVAGAARLPAVRQRPGNLTKGNFDHEQVYHYCSELASGTQILNKPEGQACRRSNQNLRAMTRLIKNCLSFWQS